MPKVIISNARGVQQEAGSGGIKVVHGSVSGSAGTEGVRVAAGGASGFLHMCQGSTTLSSSATHHTITNLVPAGSRVLGGTLGWTTRPHNSFNVTSIGNSNDRDAFSGTIALSSSVATGTLTTLSPIALITTSTGSSDVTLTTGNTGTSWKGAGSSAGATVTEGVARVTLFVATAATTEG